MTVPFLILNISQSVRRRSSQASMLPAARGIDAPRDTCERHCRARSSFTPGSVETKVASRADQLHGPAQDVPFRPSPSDPRRACGRRLATTLGAWRVVDARGRADSAGVRGSDAEQHVSAPWRKLTLALTYNTVNVVGGASTCDGGRIDVCPWRALTCGGAWRVLSRR